MESARNRVRTWVLPALLCAALATPPAAAGAAFVPGEIVVGFGADTSRSESKQVVAALDGRVIERIPAADAALVDLPPDLGVRRADALLEGESEVAFAEPNFVYRAQVIPNDTRFNELWGLHNPGGAPIFGTPDADIDAPEAWDVTTGAASVRVGIVDSGMAVQHPDLDGNVWVNPGETPGNGIDDDLNGKTDDVNGWDFVESDNTPDDANSHGTHVSGTAGAEGNNATGITGVNWDVSLMALKAGDAEGSLFTTDIAQAFLYARDEGARVVNASFSASAESILIRQAIEQSPGVLFVAAAGNAGANLDGAADEFPCETNLPNVICVAASTPLDTLASFSNFGKSAVDLAAPGGSNPGVSNSNILSTIPAFESPLFFDDLQSGGANWVTGGTPNPWARVDSGGGDFVLSDSPGVPYAQGANNWVRTLGPEDLTGENDCRIRFDHVRQLAQGDSLFVEGTTTPAVAASWMILGQFTGNGSGVIVADTQGFDGQNGFHFRFRLQDNGDGTESGGVNVDDVALECSDPAGDTYGFKSGTSMAAPHVAGAAALVLAARPGYSVAQLRTALLNTVDQKAALACSVVSGGRLNVASAIATGAGTAPPPPNNCSSSPTGTAQQPSGSAQAGDEPRRCGAKEATIVGTDGKNRIKGTGGPDVITAGGGADTVFGRGGNDRICGEGGKDRLFGGPGKDRLVGGPAKDLQVQ